MGGICRGGTMMCVAEFLKEDGQNMLWNEI